MAERIKKSDIIEGKPFEELGKEIEKALKVQNSYNEELKETAKVLKQVNKEQNKDLQTLTKINKAERDSEKLLQEKIRTEKATLQLQQQKERIRKAEIKEKERLEKIEARRLKQLADENNAYKKLVKETRDYKNESKRLGAELLSLEAKGKRNTKEYAKLEREYRRITKAAKAGDKQLKKLDKTVGDNFRNVGNYRSALGKLNQTLGSLGIAFGGAMIARDVFGVVKDFEQAQADLASVLGVNVDEMSRLTDQAKELGATTRFTAAEVSQLQTELAKLGFTEQQITDMTPATLDLAEATGSDLAEAASVAGATMNGFGLSAKETERVVNVMAKSFSSSSLDMSKFSTAMASVAPVAKNAGFSIEETTALIGTLTDRGIDASTAGTGLRNMFLNAQKAGLTFNQALEQINNASDKSGEALKLFGTRGATLGVILAENQQGVADLTKEIEDNENAAANMAKTQRDTLGGALAELRSAWEGYILGVNGSTGASEKLKEAVQFLSKNLSTILSTIGTLVKIFLIYKTRLIALNLAQKIFNAGNGKMNVSLKQMTKNLKEGAKAGTGLGGALKGIGWTALIAFAADFAMELWNVASGASAAESAVRRLQNAGDKAAESTSKNLDIIRQKRDDEINQIRLSGASQTEQTKQIQAVNERYQKTLQNEINRTIELKKASADLRAERGQAAAEYKEQNSILGDLTGNAFIEYNKLYQAAVDAAEADEAYTKKLELLRAELTNVNQVVVDGTIDLKEQNKATNEAAKSVKEYKDALEDIESVFERIREAETTNRIEALEFNIEDNDKRIQQEIEFTQRTGIARGEMVDKILAEERRMQEELIQIRFEEEMANATNNSERQLARDRRNRELLRLDENLRDKRIEIINQLNEAQESTDKSEVEATEEKYNELFNIYKSFQEAITQVLTDQIDARIEQSKREEEAAKDRQDYFEELAAQGNIYAQQSVAEQIEIQREAQAEQIRLEQQKQRVEAISGGLATFSSLIESGKTPQEALTQTVTSTQALISILKNIPFFATGTNYAPEGMAVVDERGAEIITDRHGNIKELGTDGGARLTHLNQGDKVITANKTKGILGGLETSQVKNDNAGNSYDLLIMGAKLDKIESAIKNIPTNEMDWAGLSKVLPEFTKTTRVGGDVIKNRYRS